MKNSSIDVLVHFAVLLKAFAEAAGVNRPIGLPDTRIISGLIAV